MSERNLLKDKAAIVGIGATEFSKKSGRSEVRLAVEACDAALQDCGIDPSEVDGMVTFTQDTNPEIEIARNLGVGELSFFSRIHHGGGAACGTIQQAAMAVATGVADVVVCYRAFNERSGRRFGAGSQDRPPEPNGDTVAMSWLIPFGLVTPAQWVAMFATRYMHEFGATSEDFGRVRWPTASTPRPTQRPGSSSSRSRSRSIKPAVGSSSPCTCSIAARRATAGRRS